MNGMYSDAFTARMRNARKAAGLSREDAADRIGCSSRAIGHYECGEIKVIPPLVIPAMANAYADPALAQCYCQTQCPIGVCRRSVDTAAELNRCVLEAWRYSRDRLQNALATIVDISKDRFIPRTKYNACRRSLDEIENRIAQLWTLFLSVDGLLARSLRHEEEEEAAA